MREYSRFEHLNVICRQRLHQHNILLTDTLFPPSFPPYPGRVDRYNHDLDAEEETEDDGEDFLFHSFSSCSPRYSRVYNRGLEPLIHDVNLALLNPFNLLPPQVVFSLTLVVSCSAVVSCSLHPLHLPVMSLWFLALCSCLQTPSDVPTTYHLFCSSFLTPGVSWKSSVVCGNYRLGLGF